MQFNYTVKSSRRAKYIRIRVNHDGSVVVTKPWLVPKFMADRFVRSKEDWIRTALAKLKEHQPSHQNNTIWYLGKVYSFQYQPGRAAIQFGNPSVIVSAYSEEAAKRHLSTYIQKEARSQIIAAIKKWSKTMGITYQDIRFKNQKSRWGSCSSQGNLNFNWKLIMTPPEVMEYVVIHELAHRTHMDHSVKFWHLVERFDPDYRAHRRWLKRHESAINQSMI